MKMLLLLVIEGFVVFGSVLSAGTTTKSPAEDCGRFVNNKVWFGNLTEVDEYPWLALLEYETPRGQFVSCGGVLLNHRYVLTAGHCATFLGKNWTLTSVRLGEYDTSTQKDCVSEGDLDNTQFCIPEAISIKIEKAIPHEKYGSNDRGYDLALLRLAEDVKYTPYIQPICLPTKESIPQKYYVAGFGRLAGRRGSTVKLQSRISLVPNTTECKKWYANATVNLAEDQFCAGPQDSEQKPCIGDSGGPLMGVEKGDDDIYRMTVFGLLTMDSRFCDIKSWPGIFANVLNYTGWIRENMKA